MVSFALSITPKKGEAGWAESSQFAFHSKRDFGKHAYKMLRNDVSAIDAEGKMIGIIFETARHGAGRSTWYGLP
ncbi:hypothetical protein [Terriglobus tenax]|uniref:hypothetical protein n=1 Tax=Terriglobus tenax TaxID=1111115 RepID=UPI0021E03F98|nr:hypothetical protein [Terriglobus tenax]